MSKPNPEFDLSLFGTEADRDFLARQNRLLRRWPFDYLPYGIDSIHPLVVTIRNELNNLRNSPRAIFYTVAGIVVVAAEINALARIPLSEYLPH